MAQMASPVLLTEICHPQHRGKVTAIYNCLWNLGALCTNTKPKLNGYYIQEALLTEIVVAWLAWATMQIENDWSWRSLTLLQILPASIQLVFVYCKHFNSTSFER